jgi:diaminopimelate decarboxylase
MATGAEDQKFGFSLMSGAASDAVRRVLGQRGLLLSGLHCHVGSQIADIGTYEEAAARMIELLAAIRDEHGITLPDLDLGGGFAVPYRTGDAGTDPAALAERLLTTVRTECEHHRLPVPRITLEPGRAISAWAGVTIYRVIGIEHGATGRVFVAVNGGMSDNPRPALYGARYGEARGRRWKMLTCRVGSLRGWGGCRPSRGPGRCRRRWPPCG